MTTAPVSAALRKLLIAQVPADFADWLDFVAIGALLAYVWQVDPFVFAILAVSMGLPYLVIGPFAGVLVDRANINRVLIISNLGRAVMTAALVFAPTWGVLMVCIALRAAVDTFYTPAKQAAIQALSESEGRMRANGLSHAINQTSKVVAPALGGTLLIWFAPHAVFALNALVSVIAALMLLNLPIIPRAVSDDTAQTSMLQNLRAGMAEVNASPVVRPALFMVGGGYFAMFFYDTLIAPLTRDLGFSQTVLGMTLAAVGAGGVLGALILGTKDTKVHPFMMIGAGAAVSAVMVIALGISEVANISLPTLGFIAIFGILGLCSAMTVVPFRTILQNNVQPNRIGRVTALSEAINTTALLTAPFIGAAVASYFSFGAAFICGGCVMLLVALRALQLRGLG